MRDIEEPQSTKIRNINQNQRQQENRQINTQQLACESNNYAVPAHESDKEEFMIIFQPYISKVNSMNSMLRKKGIKSTETSERNLLLRLGEASSLECKRYFMETVNPILNDLYQEERHSFKRNNALEAALPKIRGILSSHEQFEDHEINEIIGKVKGKVAEERKKIEWFESVTKKGNDVIIWSEIPRQKKK